MAASEAQRQHLGNPATGGARRRENELLALIAEEPSISILVLAAGTGPEGPGPLISYLTGQAAARLRIPITIVPGGLTPEQLDAVS